MNIQAIEAQSLLNGDGIRSILWVSGCSHHCLHCQNPETWDPNGGMPFTKELEEQLFESVAEDYCSGVTLSGGDPLYEGNLEDILKLCQDFRERFGNTKTIWVYSGYYYEDIKAGKNAGDDIRLKILDLSDVFVDGPFVEALMDVNYPWAGSTNQHVIRLREKTE